MTEEQMQADAVELGRAIAAQLSGGRRVEMPQPPPGDGWIYIVGTCGTGLVKIGYSQNMRARWAVIRTDNPSPVLLYLRRGFITDERALHNRFAALRSHLEWFRFGPGNELDRFVLEAQQNPMMILDIEDIAGQERTE